MMQIRHGDSLSEPRSRAEREWGDYVTVYEHPGLKAKVLRLAPHKEIPLQFHRYHNEHWLVLEGEGTVRYDQDTQDISRGQIVDLPHGMPHAVCAGPDGLSFLEIQVALIVPGGDSELVHGA